MISCKRATELISRSIDEPLSVRDSLYLRLHLYICEFCEQFRKQLLTIRSVFRSASSADGEEVPGPSLTPGARDRILDRLKKENAGSD